MKISLNLKEQIKEKSHQLGFFLAGVTLPEPPLHYPTFENWLANGHHGTMEYLANKRSRARRANPLEILSECKSILVLATPYNPPLPMGRVPDRVEGLGVRVRVPSTPLRHRRRLAHLRQEPWKDRASHQGRPARSARLDRRFVPLA